MNRMPLIKPFVTSLLKHKKRSIIVFVVLLLILFIFRPKPQKVVETQTVTRHTLTQSISATGSIGSERSVDLTFLTGGKLTYVGVKKGDMVKAGQAIARLDQRTVQSNLQSALSDY